MRVKIIDCDGNGNETQRCICDLSECFPDDAEDYSRALSEIKRSGRVWNGGGAQPLTILIPIRD